MFGYIRVYENELKVREYKLYKSVYCGLCKTMKKQLGALSALGLSYDFVFLALLRSYAEGEGFKIRPGRCFFHPLRKRPIAEKNLSLDYCAGASAILIYYKLLDDLHDGGILKRISVRLRLPFYRRFLKRAKKNIPHINFEALTFIVRDRLEKLDLLEKQLSASPEMNAELFGELLGEIFSFGLGDPKKAESCRLLGLHLGRWIYIADLLDDFEKDKKHKHYNPLLCAGYTSLPVDLLVASLSRENELAEKALDMLEKTYSDIGAILKNILELGLSGVCNKILERTSQHTEKHSQNPNNDTNTDLPERNDQTDATGPV